ncbi:hypothetical protein LINPERHAP1_LOCUS39769 [Linum perenne]
MVSLSAQVGGSSAASWASIVAGEKLDLRFVEASKSSVVDGVLKLPKEVLEVGVKKLKAVVVAQFLGNAPPIRVIRSMINRLWGYEGEVVLYVLSENFFLFEFNSEALCNWVLARSWHIHLSAMVLRRWVKGISPIDFSPKELTVWIVLKHVPPILINPEEISWLASQVGRPINKFVRDGLDIKVCVVKDILEEMKTEIVVELDEDECAVIALDVPESRTYKETRAKKWVVRDMVPVVAASSSGFVPESGSHIPVGGGGDDTKAPEGVEKPPFQRNGSAPTRNSAPSPAKSTVDGDGVIVSDDEQNSDGVGDEKPEVGVGIHLGNATFGDFFSLAKFASPKGIVTRRTILEQPKF